MTIMIQYAAEIRVAIEALLTIGSLWWTIRTLVVMTSLNDRLSKEERQTADLLGAKERSIMKIKDSSRKIREKIIPGQIHILTQLKIQMDRMQKDLEKSNLPQKVEFYREVKDYFTEHSDSRYFRSSYYNPESDQI